MRGVPIGVWLSCSLLLAQNVGPQDRSRTRGQTPTQVPQETVNRGRIAGQAPMPNGAQTWYGVLVDAGCPQRDMIDLRMPPRETVAKESASNAGAAGIHVTQQVLATERGRVLWMHTLDHLTRQMDPACGLSGETKAFALFLPQGRWGKLINLDEGGNTMAFEAFQSSAQGRAILNGAGQPEKPIAKVAGFRRGDKIVVRSIELEYPKPAAATAARRARGTQR